MSRDDALRKRVLRLLDGQAGPHDLQILFLWLRERSRGNGIVCEIGDFAAHADKRDKKTPITNEAIEFFDHLRFSLPALRKPYSSNDLPPEFPRAVRISLNRIPESIVKKETGLRRKEATQTLDSVLSKLSTKKDGRFNLSGTLTEKEFLTLKCVTSHIISRPAFNDEQLCRGFSQELETAGLLITAERKQLNKRRAVIVLYAIYLMHQAKIILEDGWLATLHAVSHKGRLGIGCSAEISNVSGAGPLSIEFLFFETSLQAREWCDQSLVASDGDAWSIMADIELGDGPKLILL